MDEMNELYYREPYTKEFDAEKVSCTKAEDHYEIVLSDTAFYPEGGGQEADHGTLNGIAVYDVQNHDGIIIHYTKEPVEDVHVHGILDWNRRFMNMQMHTADHIFSGIVHKHFGYDNVGFGMGEHGVRMDFSGYMSEEEIRQMELEANEAIWNNLPVEASFPDADALKHMEYRSKKELKGKVRIITIPGVDVCACCGTHVQRTGEVGSIRIYSSEKYKGGVRVIMLAGKKALLEDNILCEENHKISTALSAQPQHTYESVKNLQNQLAEEKQKHTQLLMELMNYKIQSYEDNSKLAIDFEEDADRNFMVKFANTLVDEKHIETAAVLNHTKQSYAYVIISHTVDLKAYVKDINSLLNGRGGGKKDVIQGSFSAGEDKIREVLQNILG